MVRPIGGMRILRFILHCAFLMYASGCFAEVTDYSYSTLDLRQEKVFRIAFWRDPDLSRLEYSSESFEEKIRRFAVEIQTALEGPLVEAGFGDIQISVIDDYGSLLEERSFGRFNLLHCDPATYVLARNEPYDPYTVLMEEASRTPAKSNEAIVWVTAESTYRDPRELVGTHIAIVDSHSLLGGAIQWARLSESLNWSKPGPPFEKVRTGSVSEAVLRLVTGLGTEKPIQAAFLPFDSSGFQVAAQMMGLKRTEDLPIRVLTKIQTGPLPGNPLLIDRYEVGPRPNLQRELVDFFTSQKLPWMWEKSSEERYKNLTQILSPLRAMDGDSP